MQRLSGTVGEGGANARHDVALVQAILALAKRPAKLDPATPQYLRAIDGDCGGGTRAAIRQFQSDKVFVNAAGDMCQPAPNTTPGRVTADDGTWAKLLAAVPKEFSDLRVLPGSKTVYLAGTADQLNAAVAELIPLTFNATFKTSVASVIRRLHRTSGIVCRVCPDGDRRTFQKQYELRTSGRGVTGAGPGESNHNFGQAVDLGFKGLRWLTDVGKPVENETYWLHKLDPKQTVTGEAVFFWDALRQAGTQSGLFIGPVAARPHPCGVSCRAARTTLSDRRNRHPPRAPARGVDLAARRCRLLWALAADQRAFQLPYDRGWLARKRHPDGELALWQRRFWEHTIASDDDFARHVDYIHFNPVKHGVVARARDWAHSSFHRYMREGLLPGLGRRG